MFEGLRWKHWRVNHFEDLWLYFYWAQLLVSAKIDCHLDHLKIH